MQQCPPNPRPHGPRSSDVTRRRSDDKVLVWVHRAQIPIGIAGVVLGVYEVLAGYVLVGIVVVVLACTAATIAISRLRP
jgi:hypothetical protein